MILNWQDFNVGSILGTIPVNLYPYIISYSLALGNMRTVDSLNFRVTEIAPGLTNTPVHERIYGKEFAEHLVSSGKRILQPEDVADSMVYALSAPPHVQITKLFIDTTDPP